MTRTRSSFDAGPSAEFTFVVDMQTYSGYCTSNPSVLERTTNVVVGPGAASWTISKSMTDVVTPNFKRLQKSGKIVNSPMTQVINTVIEPACNIDISFDTLNYCTGLGKRLSSHTHYHGLGNFIAAAKPLSMKYTTDSAITDAQKNAVIEVASAQAYANINHTDLLILASVAESGKTVKGLTQLLYSVYKVLRRIKRKQFKKLYKDASKPGNYADLYMQARYELRPLYHDIMGLKDAINRVFPPINSRETFRGYDEVSKSKVIDTNFNQTYGSAFNLTCPCIFRQEVQQTFSCRAGVLTQFLGAPSGVQYGFKEIPETLWELVPFSFIVDWFLNVGTVIAAWTPNVESKPLASWVVTESTVTKSAKVIAQSPVYGSVGPTSPEAVNASCEIDAHHYNVTTTKTRTPFAKRYSVPHWNINIDPLKILDLGIILGNLSKLRGSTWRL